MSIFDNIIFDEFTLLEGEQVEAYKKKKAEDKSTKNKAELDRFYRRYDRDDYDDTTDKAKKVIDKEFKNRIDKVDDISKDPDNFGWKERLKRVDNAMNIQKARRSGDYQDGVKRHIRRHPNQYKESAFENIKMI